MEIPGLPNARFVKIRCARCKETYLMDLGGVDRHEYVVFVGGKRTTCPLCGCKMIIEEDLMKYGIVRN